MGLHSLMFVQPFTYFYDITQHMAKRKSNTGIPGLSFSWKRALGITQAKQKFARETGIITISLATIGFVLFRIIDITKPLGCRWIDKNIHGGWGCMLDDALAGFYALLLTLSVRYLHLVEYAYNFLFLDD